MKKYNLFILILFNVSALFSQDSDYEVFKYNNYKEVKLYSVNKIGKNGKYIGKYCLGENINFYKNGFDNDSVYDFKISIFSKHTDVFYANDRKKRKFYSFSFGDFPYHVYSIDVFNENFDTIFEFKIKFDSLGNYKSIGSYSLVYDSLNRLKFYEAKRGIGVARTDYYYSDDKIEVIDSQKDIQFLKNGIKRKIVTYFENGKIISTKTFDYKYDFIERKDYYFLNKEIIFMYDDNNIINYCIFNYYSKNKKGKILCNSYITRVEVIEQK